MYAEVDDAWILERLQQAYRSRDRQGMSDLLNEIKTDHTSLKNNISVREAERGVEILNAATSKSTIIFALNLFDTLT